MAIREVVAPSIADDVYRGLTKHPKSLPPKLFYDAKGSALFEEITRLPEYYVTRTELGIFTDRACEIAKLWPTNASIVELGAGTSAKTRVLLHAMSAKRMQVLYYPVDISPAALDIARTTLRTELPHVRTNPIVADLAGDLRFLTKIPAPRVVLYIGSSIGNMQRLEADAFLRRVAAQLQSGDSLLLGTDLVKDRAVLLTAYNDAAGVTARFNLNVLERINRELGADFRVNNFRHEAVWNARKSRIEMYLESTREQEVWLEELGTRVHFKRGERIHTENSHKYTVRRVRSMLRGAGFEPQKTWTDAKDWFAVTWARKVLSAE